MQSKNISAEARLTQVWIETIRHMAKPHGNNSLDTPCPECKRLSQEMGLALRLASPPSVVKRLDKPL